jgi:hypothetical protein
LALGAPGLPASRLQAGLANASNLKISVRLEFLTKNIALANHYVLKYIQSNSCKTLAKILDWR